MARAKKCDRCGAFYEKNIAHTRVAHNKHTVIDGVVLSLAIDEYAEYKDLCDDCIAKLILFLSGRDLAEPKE